ncbi:hypothetical protein [Roseobacter litoralis]|uniref:Uncharacterized protein n=1 Tax=Roseobacter litoralis (strain ATCC 49566 / DSM 6996 / JCM 21268 / NBRC 15278 / OCh 149) TaxID=391595 RepID=F7ZA43_ROSLO|nr:hypothetical protein [Roseobacter litoralis]AEI94196.1 hypothetical protein RLO149_c022200 [Roseobacter litoralis Och 149]
MARPTITLSPSQVQEVETLAALLTQAQIADYFGISRATFQAILGRDDEVVVHYKRGKAKAIAHVANGLLQKARSGHTASMIFYLKTQGGWRETAEMAHVVEEGTDGRGADKLKVLLDEIAAKRNRIGVDRLAGAGAPHAAVREEQP